MNSKRNFIKSLSLVPLASLLGMSIPVVAKAMSKSDDGPVFDFAKSEQLHRRLNTTLSYLDRDVYDCINFFRDQLTCNNKENRKLVRSKFNAFKSMYTDDKYKEIKKFEFICDSSNNTINGEFSITGSDKIPADNYSTTRILVDIKVGILVNGRVEDFVNRYTIQLDGKSQYNSNQSTEHGYYYTGNLK